MINNIPKQIKKDDKLLLTNHLETQNLTEEDNKQGCRTVKADNQSASEVQNKVNYLHNKFKEEGKYISKKYIKEAIQEGINLTSEQNKVSVGSRPSDLTVITGFASEVQTIKLNLPCKLCNKEIYIGQDLVYLKKECFHLDCYKSKLLTQTKYIIKSHIRNTYPHNCEAILYKLNEVFK